MLVLKRKKYEAIIIGDEIKIVVTEIKKDSVSIGIEAPRHINIRREELEVKSNVDTNT